jgi:hypothetical protein
MASVTVQSGTTNGTINSSSSFDWENTSTTGSCSVTGVGDWCAQSSYTVPQAASATSPGKKSATTLNVTGNFSYSSSCYDAPGSPVIRVGSK